MQSYGLQLIYMICLVFSGLTYMRGTYIPLNPKLFGIPYCHPHAVKRKSRTRGWFLILDKILFLSFSILFDHNDKYELLGPE